MLTPPSYYCTLHTHTFVLFPCPLHFYIFSLSRLCPPCLLFSALLMLSLYVFSLSLLLLLRRVSCSLLGHNRNPRHSCHTTLFSHIIRAWAWARITFMWLFPFTTIWSGRWHTLPWTHTKCSARAECLVLGITKTFQRMLLFLSALCFTLRETGPCHVLLWALWFFLWTDVIVVLSP